MFLTLKALAQVSILDKNHQHVQQCGHKEDILGIYFFYFIRHINSSSHSRQVF
jgi:hypothetical protein